MTHFDKRVREANNFFLNAQEKIMKPIGFITSDMGNYRSPTPLQFDSRVIHPKEKAPAKAEAFSLERVTGIEPVSPDWQPGVIAIIRYPHQGIYYKVF